MGGGASRVLYGRMRPLRVSCRIMACSFLLHLLHLQHTSFLNRTCSDNGTMIYPGNRPPTQRVLLFGEGLLVYVQFAKVGSSSMRELMRHWAGEYRDYSTMYLDARPRGHDVPLTQVSAAQSKYGLCDVLWLQRPSKPCTYFTLLRHPVARLKSSYEYFCKGCREHERYCSHRLLMSRSGLRCPNMSLIDFAYLEGNMYTYEFSGAYACSRCNKMEHGVNRYDDQYHLACDDGALPIHEYQMLRTAKAHLEAYVFPLILEELDLRSFHAHLNYSHQMDMAGYKFPTRNKMPHNDANNHEANSAVADYTLTAAHEEELRHILSLDMALYNHARRIAQRWAALLQDSKR